MPPSIQMISEIRSIISCLRFWLPLAIAKVMIGSCQLQHYEAVDPLAPPFSHETPHVTDSTRFIPKPPLCGDLNPHGNHHPICGLWKVFPCDYHCAWIHVKKSKVVYIESIIAPPFLLFSSHLLGGHGNFAKVEKAMDFFATSTAFFAPLENRFEQETTLLKLVVS